MFTQVTDVAKLKINDLVYVPGYKKPKKVIQVFADGVKVSTSYGNCRVIAKSLTRVFSDVREALR